VLKAITPTGVLVLARDEVPNDGLAIGLGEIGLNEGPPELIEVLDQRAEKLPYAVPPKSHDQGRVRAKGSWRSRSRSLASS
jgi:hypothetical protein